MEEEEVVVVDSSRICGSEVWEVERSTADCRSSRGRLEIQYVYLS